MLPMRTALLLSALLLAASAHAAPAMSVASVEGGALTRASGKLKAGDALKDGEKLSLSAGRAVLRVGDAGHVLVKGPAKFVVNPGDKAGFQLRLGALLSVLPRLAGELFSVRTPAAVAAVRGTDFYVAAGQLDTYVCACDGKLDIGASKGEHPSLPLEGTHHNARRYRTGPKGVVEAPVDAERALEKHTDEGLAALRAR